MYYQKLDEQISASLSVNVFIPYSSFQVETTKEKRNNDGKIIPFLNIFPLWNFWQSARRFLRISKINQRQSFIYNPNLLPCEKTHQKTVPLRVLLIGIHGFFPEEIIRSLIGSPRGTSWKFINNAELAVYDYFQKLNIPIQIGKIALQKNGCVMERVKFLLIN